MPEFILLSGIDISFLNTLSVTARPKLWNTIGTRLLLAFAIAAAPRASGRAINSVSEIPLPDPGTPSPVPSRKKVIMLDLKIPWLRMLANPRLKSAFVTEKIFLRRVLDLGFRRAIVPVIINRPINYHFETGLLCP